MMTGSLSASAQEMRLITGWDSSYAPITAVLDPFIERLSQETNGQVSISRFGPETVPPFEQLDPVSRGLFDLLFTNGAYHATDTSVGMTFDAVSATPQEIRASGMWNAVDAHYQTLDLKLIAVMFDLNGYHVILRGPLGEGAFEGRRIRGTPIYHPLIEALGGAPVVLPAAEIYPSLERGVVDGASWPTVGAVGFRWYEVADYMMRPTFGQVGHLVLMNLDRWNSLDADTQATISRVGEAFEIEAVEIMNGVVAQEEATLQAEGMQVTELPEAFRAVTGPAWYEGAMTLAARTNPDDVAAIRVLVEAAGLAGN
jgi:TRAP-type C4-dicarboxylate transport system substrate-binding protein